MATSRSQYVGFSSVGRDAGSTTLVGADIVIADLLNGLLTPLGSVPGRPGFGSAIGQLVGEPLNDVTKSVFREEVRRVTSYDPRIRLLSSDLSSDEEGVLSASLSIRIPELGRDVSFSFELEAGQEVL